MRVLLDLAPLRQSPPFARLWLTGILVSVSAQMMQMGVAWALYEQTNSSLAVGGLGLAIGVSTVAFGLVGGALASWPGGEYPEYCRDGRAAVGQLSVGVAGFARGDAASYYWWCGSRHYLHPGSLCRVD